MNINMHFTWDEAMLVHDALRDSRFDAEHNYVWNNDEERNEAVSKLADLQERIGGVMGITPAFSAAEEGADRRAPREQ